MTGSSLAGILTCLLSIFATSLGAQQPPTEYQFDIAQMPLGTALIEFSHVTSLQVLYLPENSSEEYAIVGPVRGRLTADAALRALLKPTPFTFSWVNRRTIGIERAPPPPPKRAKRTWRSDDGEPEQTQAALEAYRHFRIADVEVEGERWRRTSVDDGIANPQSFDRAAIERMGASTVADVIRNISQQTYMRPEGFRASGAQYAELRGLGSPDNTLVLINGRRAFPSAANITTNAFDLNTIPLPAVERIEVLVDPASAAHGADSIGGIVNIILRSEIPDPAAEVHYGTAAGGASQSRLSLSGGFHRDDVSATLVMDYFELRDLIGAERALWRDQDYRRFGGPDQRSLLASPGNITSLTSDFLPGLSSRVAAVPTGSVGNTIEDFIPTAGQFNHESLTQHLSIVPQARRFSATGMIEWKLNERLSASAEVVYADRSADFQATPPIVADAVPATNAFNPFGATVFVQSLLSEVGPQRQNVETKLLRAVAAVRGALWKWRWEVSVLDTQEDAWAWTDNVLDSVRTRSALAHSDRNQALDVFNDVSGSSPELLASLVAERRVDILGSHGQQVGAILGGSLFNLSAGAVSTVLGGEWRKEAGEFDTRLGTFDRNVAAAFAEARIPLVGARTRLPAVQELSLTLGGRWDHFSDIGTVFNPQYALMWKPNHDLVVRLAQAERYRAPSIHELYLPDVSVQSAVIDPKRGGAATPIALIVGGNRDLVPVNGDVRSASITFTPSSLPALTLHTNYWRIKMTDRIPMLTPSFLVAHEAAFSDRVIRGTPTPADIAAGRPGPILIVDNSRVNLGLLETDGIDLGASYDIETGVGRFTPGLSATWIDQYKTVDIPGIPAQDRVNVANELGTIVRWRATASLGWGRGPLSAFVVARHMPSYEDAVGGVRTGRIINSQTTFDVQASIDLGAFAPDYDLWRGMRLTVGAVNASNELPEFAQVNALAGFDFSQGDLKGRFYYVRLGKTF